MASASLLIVATALFVGDDRVNPKLRNYRPGPRATHHQLHEKYGAKDMPDREKRGWRRGQLRAFDAKSLWRCGESYPRPSRHTGKNTKYTSQLRPPGGRHRKFGNSRRRLFRQAAQIIADAIGLD
jgi:hypothetical protein